MAVDVQIAFASGLPPLIKSGHYNVATICEAGEESLCEDQNAHGEPTESIIGIFAGGEQNFHQKSGDIMLMLQRDKLSCKDVDDMLNLINQVREDVTERRRRISVIQQTFSLRQGHSDEILTPCPSEDRLAQFTRTIPALLAIKPFAVMYGSIMRHNLLPYLLEREP